MPCNTTFVKSTLKQCLGQEVEVRRLLDYLQSIIDSPSQKRSVSEFVGKWSSSLQNNSRKTMIITYIGTWPPNCLNEKEIQKQAKWEDFARSYDSAFSGCTVDSQCSLEYLPLNFEELLKLTFWEELYQNFGNKIVAHIFDKCALLFEVDESLYLIVANPKGGLYKKIATAQTRNGKTAKKTQNVLTQADNKCNPYQSTAPELERPADNREVGKENADSLTTCRKTEAVVQETGNMKRSRTISSTENHEVMEPEKKKMKIDESITKSSQTQIRANINRWIRPKPEVVHELIERRNSLLELSQRSTIAYSPQRNWLTYVCVREDEDEIFNGKDKLSVLKQSATVSVNNPVLPENWEGLKLPSNLTSIADKNGNVVIYGNIISETFAKKLQLQLPKDNGTQSRDNVIRWIRPTPEVLQKLFERVKFLQLSRKDLLTYVLIQQDEVFKARDKLFVLKQSATVSADKPKLPQSWGDLRLPDKSELTTITDNGNIVLHVYIISETLAKELNIRIKPKGRQRKKSLMNKQTSGNSKATESESPTVLSSMSENMQNQKLPTKTSINNKQALEQEKETFLNIKPYLLNASLPIVSCLYNKSSWSKWPDSHSLLEAVKRLRQQNEIGAIKAVIEDVLKQETCSIAAHTHLIKSLIWNASDFSHPMSKIVVDIVQMHSKIKVVHTLFKNCVSYWRVKYYRKQEKKKHKATISRSNSNTHRKLPATDTKDLEIPELIDLTNSIPKNFEMQVEEPEVIDLTQNSPQNTHHIIRNSGSTPINRTAPATLSTNAEKNAGAKSTQATSSQKPKCELQRKSSWNSCTNKFFSSLKFPVPQNCVMQSLKQIFYIMKVDKLLGSKRNIRGFFKFVRKALILGGTKSSLHLSELMAMIHPSEMPIVHTTNCEHAVEIFAAKLVQWLFNEYVLVLLKTCCYITESSFSRMHLNFYLRESWTSAYYRMKAHLLKKGALEVLKSKEKQPNAVIRYVPKQNHSLRSLLVMKKSVWSLTKEESKELNIYLHYVDAKINKSRMHLPTTIQHEWRKFYLKWKASGSPKLYYLRMDIRDAYPSVCLKKMNDILMKSGGGRLNQMVMKRYMLVGGNGIKRRRDSIFDSSNRDNWYSGIHVRPCIVMDLNRDKTINVWKMLNHITSIINTTNVVQIGKKPYEFHYGLPQGWSQSPILCNIYYGYIDTSLYLPYLEESSNCLFLRVVDDYLFVTPKSSDVSDLIQLMKIGCARYGIVLNEEKSENNVPNGEKTEKNIDSEITNTSCERVTFCGWNFCMKCGHVSRDFKKYNGQDFCSTITFSIPTSISSPDQFLRLRGTVIVPARVKPILLDPVINCYKRILLTVFEASVILGFRFYAICRVVYPNLNVLNEHERVTVIMSCINLCCTRLATFAERNSQHSGPPFYSQEKASCADSCCGGENTSKEEVVKDQLISVNSLMFTSYHGFRMKLLNHSGVFEKVLPRLNRSILKLREKLGNELCNNILEIVGYQMPDCFSGIII